MRKMEFKELIRERRSVRAYCAAPELEELVKILTDAQQAPSWKNSQTTRWYVVETPEKHEELRQACIIAHADDFIERLPQGYDTVLSGDGANLSQGQRQLISIARVAVADPPVMILDEATSSIDTRTEQLVQSGMDNLMKGRTVFVIAHRLSTIRNSDCIMVMDGGRIIERGNHKQLMEKQGVYYALNK